MRRQRALSLAEETTRHYDTAMSLLKRLPAYPATSFLAVLLIVAPMGGQGPSSRNLTVDDVVAMLEAQLPEEVVLARIRASGKPFELSTEELVRLKKAGASQQVMITMMNPGGGTGPIAKPERSSRSGPMTEPVEVANTETAPSSRAILIQDRTSVQLVLTEAISSETARQNDIVNFQVNEDVLVNGVVVIPKGTFAVGHVVVAERRGRWGKDGRLQLAVDYLKIGASNIRLEATIGEAELKRSMLGMMLGLSGAFKKGKAIELPAGTVVNALVDGDKQIYIPSSGGAVSTTAPGRAASEPLVPTAAVASLEPAQTRPSEGIAQGVAVERRGAVGAAPLEKSIATTSQLSESAAGGGGSSNADPKDFNRSLKDYYDGKTFVVVRNDLLAGEYVRQTVGPGQAALVLYHFHNSIDRLPKSVRTGGIGATEISRLNQLDDRTFTELRSGLNVTKLVKGEHVRVNKFYVRSNYVELHVEPLDPSHLQDLDINKASRRSRTTISGGQVSTRSRVAGFGLRCLFFFDEEKIIRSGDIKTITDGIKTFFMTVEEARKLKDQADNIEIDSGMAEEDLINKLGQPIRSIKVGSEKVLKYPDLAVTVKDGAVTKVAVE